MTRQLYVKRFCITNILLHDLKHSRKLKILAFLNKICKKSRYKHWYQTIFLINHYLQFLIVLYTYQYMKLSTCLFISVNKPSKAFSI